MTFLIKGPFSLCFQLIIHPTNMKIFQRIKIIVSQSFNITSKNVKEDKNKREMIVALRRLASALSNMELWPRQHSKLDIVI